MQEQINEKTVAISVKTAKLTAEILQKAIKKLLDAQKHKAPKQYKFVNFEEQPKDPAALQTVLRDEKHSREHSKCGDIKLHIEKLSGREKKPSLRAQLAQDRKTVKTAPKKQAAKTKNKGLEV